MSTKDGKWRSRFWRETDSDSDSDSSSHHDDFTLSSQAEGHDDPEEFTQRLRQTLCQAFHNKCSPQPLGRAAATLWFSWIRLHAAMASADPIEVLDSARSLARQVSVDACSKAEGNFLRAGAASFITDALTLLDEFISQDAVQIRQLRREMSKSDAKACILLQQERQSIVIDTRAKLPPSTRASTMFSTAGQYSDAAFLLQLVLVQHYRGQPSDWLKAAMRDLLLEDLIPQLKAYGLRYFPTAVLDYAKGLVEGAEIDADVGPVIRIFHRQLDLLLLKSAISTRHPQPVAYPSNSLCEILIENILTSSAKASTVIQMRQFDLSRLPDHLIAALRAAEIRRQSSRQTRRKKIASAS